MKTGTLVKINRSFSTNLELGLIKGMVLSSDNGKANPTNSKLLPRQEKVIDISQLIEIDETEYLLLENIDIIQKPSAKDILGIIRARAAAREAAHLSISQPSEVEQLLAFFEIEDFEADEFNRDY